MDSYEKKYKEALEKARQLCAYPTTKPFINDIQDLFPELKEPEDEKTRKRIIALVNAHGQGMYKDDMLAWLENIPYTIDHEKREGFHLGYKAALERQDKTFTKKDVDDAYVEGMALAKHELEKQGNSPIKWNKNTERNKPQVNHSVLMKTTQGIAEGEWKGEYWHQYRWAGIVRDSDVLSWMELSDLDKQGEQKPAWSEEDKRMFDYALDMIEWYGGKNEKRVRLVSDWLKSLKQRIGG